MNKYFSGLISGIVFTLIFLIINCSDRDNITDSTGINLAGQENFSVKKYVFETSLASDTLKLPFLINEHDILIFAYRSLNGDPYYLTSTRNYRSYKDEIWIDGGGYNVKLVVLDLGKH